MQYLNVFILFYFIIWYVTITFSCNIIEVDVNLLRVEHWQTQNSLKLEGTGCYMPFGEYLEDDFIQVNGLTVVPVEFE